MIIQEAINSGRPFRRKGWTHYLTPKLMDNLNRLLSSYDRRFAHQGEEDTILIFQEGSVAHGVVVGVTLRDILALDWEVQEEQITITREQFQQAYVKTHRAHSPYLPEELWEYLTTKENSNG